MPSRGVMILGRIVIPLLSLFIPFIVMYASRDTAELSYNVVSITSLKVRNRTDSPDIIIMYKGIPISNLYTVTIEIMNTGSTSIYPSDFEREVNITFGPNAQILDFNIAKVSPRSLSPSLTAHANYLSLAPLLLNPHDTMRFDVNIAGTLKWPKLDARVANIPELREIPPPQLDRIRIYPWLVVISFYAFAGGYAYILSRLVYCRRQFFLEKYVRLGFFGSILIVILCLMGSIWANIVFKRIVYSNLPVWTSNEIMILSIVIIVFWLLGMYITRRNQLNGTGGVNKREY